MVMSKKEIKIFNKSRCCKDMSVHRSTRNNSKAYNKWCKRRDREDVCWEIAFAIGNLRGGLTKRKKMM